MDHLVATVLASTILLTSCSAGKPTHRQQDVKRTELQTYVLSNGTYYGYDPATKLWYTAFNNSDSPNTPMSRTSLENPEFPRPLRDTITWIRAQTPPPASVKSAHDDELDAEGAKENGDVSGTRINEATKYEQDTETTAGTH